MPSLIYLAYKIFYVVSQSPDMYVIRSVSNYTIVICFLQPLLGLSLGTYTNICINVIGLILFNFSFNQVINPIILIYMLYIASQALSLAHICLSTCFYTNWVYFPKYLIYAFYSLYGSVSSTYNNMFIHLAKWISI